jgi:hypothetical protein
MRAKPDCLGSPKNNHWHWQIEGCTLGFLLPRLACGSPKLIGSGTSPWLTPSSSQWAWMIGTDCIGSSKPNYHTITRKNLPAVKAWDVEFHRNLMQFTDENVNKRFQAHMILWGWLVTTCSKKMNIADYPHRLSSQYHVRLKSLIDVLILFYPCSKEPAKMINMTLYRAYTLKKQRYSPCINQ